MYALYDDGDPFISLMGDSDTMQGCLLCTDESLLFIRENKIRFIKNGSEIVWKASQLQDKEQ